MINKTKKRLMSWVLVLMILLSTVSPMNIALANEDTADSSVSQEAGAEAGEKTPAQTPGEDAAAPEEKPDQGGAEEKEEELPNAEEELPAGAGAFSAEENLLAAAGSAMPYGTPATLDADVTVEGVEDGGTIDGSKGVKVTVSFPVPVIGDGVEDYFQYGDEVELLLSESFQFDPVPGAPIELNYKGKKLGTVTLTNNAGQAVAKIKFDGDEDIFDPEQLEDDEQPYSGVSGTFTADLMYNGHSDEGEDGGKTVAILEKTYQLQLPGDQITYRVEKKAEGAAVNLDEGTITWTVTLTAEKDTQPDPTPVDLEGYVFEDDLKDVGAYAGGSFSPSGGTLVTPNPDADPPTTLLSYTFPKGSVSPQTVTYKTQIPNDTLTSGGSITNGADLKLDDESVAFDDATVTISKPSVTKTGKATQNDPTGATYDPTNRTITWTIEVDSQGRTLQDLTITDQLKDGLTLASAKWQKWNEASEAEDKWEDVVPAKTWTGPAVPTNDQYVIGDVNYKGRLVIVTKVPDGTDGEVVAKTYYNQAGASWTGSGGTTGSATTGNPGVGIGYDAITKKGEQTGGDAANHQITWTIDVDLKGQSAADFKVYDLFVHDKNTADADLTGAAGWPAGLAIGSGGVTRNNGQQFAGVDSTTDGHLTVTPIELKKDGKVIATLVEVTGLHSSGSNKAVLKSQVLDPDILAGNNAGQKVYNYAELYRGVTHRGRADANVNYNNKVLSKELLGRAEVANDHDPGAVIDPNNRTTDAADGFHYGYKEAIFRLNVNAAGLDFADVETSLTDGFGDVTVIDTLPAGWEFKQFSGGRDYLIYAADGPLKTGSGFPATGSLTADGDPLDLGADLAMEFGQDEHGRQTAAFTFKNLDKPYVVLVKAGPTNATLDGYLTGDNTRSETNTLGLRSVNWEAGKSVEQKVTVNSKVLDKTLDLSKAEEGILTWTVDYTPLDRAIGTGVEDTIPQGIDLRTDSSGQLIWEDNISVQKLTLKSDGSGQYEAGEPLSPEELQAGVRYGNAARKLTFTFPDKAQAYRLTYVTDITGTPGLVTNAVKLVDAEGTGTGTEESFTVSEQHGAATMGRSGFLVVKKVNLDKEPLEKAEFTLYNTNADGSKGSPRAVRTTGPDGTVKFYGLAPGKYILVETKAPADYENPSAVYHVTVAENLTTTVDGSPTVTAGSPFTVANYLPTDPVGSLTITKMVAGNAGETDKQFDFTVTLLNLDGEEDADVYSYTGSGVPGGSIQSGGVISLAHGQSITISGLPEGTRYRVREADYSGDGYRVAETGATGEIETGVTSAAAFTNTKNRTPGPEREPRDPVDSLTIRKTVMGGAGDRQRQFTFVVTLGAGGRYSYSGSKSGTVASGEKITLGHGEYIEIRGLPVGTTYEVTEEEANRDGYRTAAAGAQGTISRGGQTAEFTNTREGVNPNTGDDWSGSGAVWGVVGFSATLAGLLGLDVYLGRKKKKHEQN